MKDIIEEQRHRVARTSSALLLLVSLIAVLSGGYIYSTSGGSALGLIVSLFVCVAGLFSTVYAAESLFSLRRYQRESDAQQK